MNIVMCGQGGADPVAPEIREQLVEPFISAVGVVLAELAHTEVAVREVQAMQSPTPLGDIVAVLGLQSERLNAMALCFTERTALTLTRRVLGEAGHVTDHALVYDCMGEIANVTAGQAKALLVETPYRFTFSVPTVAATGRGLVPTAVSGEHCLVVVFGCDAGDFALQLFPRDPKARE